MHCLQCLPPAVAESSYTPSQFIMGVAFLNVMPRPLPFPLLFVEIGFYSDISGNQDVTVKLKYELIFITF